MSGATNSKAQAGAPGIGTPAPNGGRPLSTNSAKPLKNVPYASEYRSAIGFRQSTVPESRSKNRISSPGFDLSGPGSAASTAYTAPDGDARSGTRVKTNRTGISSARHASRSARSRASCDA